MTAKTIMVQGTASSVGKSILVTALCRIFKQDGYRVAPFKSQNMALNSFVTSGGGEIGRAQAVQAEACGIAPTVDMNPILLKPEANMRSQVIVLGKVARHIQAHKYAEHTPQLLEIARNSLAKLRQEYDVVVIEGAGSTAEVNLQEREIVNMRIARLADSPVLLVGDIDRGGVFASLIGTLDLLREEERSLVQGLIINKFRGEKALFKSGVDFLEAKTGKPVLGVIPFLDNLGIAQEDSVFLDEKPHTSGEGLKVVIIRVPHTANYDDFDPWQSTGCDVKYVSRASEVGRPDLLILPGTKSTIHDMLFLKQQGIDRVIQNLAAEGIPIIGVCGGFQLLGKTIRDPLQVESSGEEAEGLGLLPVETVFAATKSTAQVTARIICNKGLLKGLSDCAVSGYEIHMGQTLNPQIAPLGWVFQSPLNAGGYFDGCVNESGLVFGTYLHGIFHNAAFMDGLLKNLREMKGLPPVSVVIKSQEEEYDRLADRMRANLDVDRIYAIMGLNLKK
ncbi:MAG TPA: cobyric acid synthase [Dehalococcoidales bacterium]|nr:cobyric acid synthase [Dehalococcoidales bacterium]